MGLDIGVLARPELAVTDDDATDDHYEDESLRYIRNDPAFVGNGDGRPPGFYRGEWHHFGGWSYGGYNALREKISRAAFGLEPHVIWNEPESWREHEYGDLVPLISFSDCEGFIGPATAAKVAAALSRLRPTLAAANDDYTLEGVDRLYHCLRFAADTQGFAVWR